MPPVSLMIKPASGLCNLRCQYCFYRDETERRSANCFGFMEERTLRNVIRRTFLQAEGEVSVVFQGGEPLLRGPGFFRKAVEYEKQYNRSGLTVRNAVQTNGTLIDEEWCRFFYEHHFLVGLSLDGVRETHDVFRTRPDGSGTFDSVLEAAALLKRFGVEYNILTVVTRAVAENIGSIYSFYKKKGWGYQQYIACLEPCGRGGTGGAYALTPGLYGRFLTGLFELWYADLEKGCQPVIRQFENYIGILLGLCPESCDMIGSCGIQYAVEADGSVYPCDFYMTDEYLLGNFNEDRLPAADLRRQELRFSERSREKPPECARCDYAFLCRGGCMRHRDQSPDGFHNYFCGGFKMFFDACLPRMREAAERLRSRNGQGG